MSQRPRELVRKYRRWVLSSCAFCGRGGRLQVHHMDKNWQNNHCTNLVTLCQACHAIADRKRPRWVKGYVKRILEARVRLRSAVSSALEGYSSAQLSPADQSFVDGDAERSDAPRHWACLKTKFHRSGVALPRKRQASVSFLNTNMEAEK